MRSLPILFCMGILVQPMGLKGQSGVGQCTAPDAELKIDHVVVAVRDLEAASDTYRGLGFTEKDGRLHANGLKNKHLKFRDGTELELMTVVNDPGDEMARGYTDFLQRGEGGAYLAMDGGQQKVAAAAVKLGIDTKLQNTGPFRYVTFSDPGLEGLFFLEYEHRVEEPAAVLSHENGSEGISMVWLEVAPQFGALLSALGASDCGESTLPDGRIGTTYGVSGGAVVVTPPRRARPRVTGALLHSTESAGAEVFPPEATHGVWLLFSPSPRATQAGFIPQISVDEPGTRSETFD